VSWATASRLHRSFSRFRSAGFRRQLHATAASPRLARRVEISDFNPSAKPYCRRDGPSPAWQSERSRSLKQCVSANDRHLIGRGDQTLCCPAEQVVLNQVVATVPQHPNCLDHRSILTTIDNAVAANTTTNTVQHLDSPDQRIEELTFTDRHVVTADHRDRGTMLRRAKTEPVHDQANQRNIATIGEPDTVARRRIVFDSPHECVGANSDSRTISGIDRQLSRAVNCIARDRDALRMLQLNASCLATKNITSDRDQPGRPMCGCRTSVNSHVGSARLNGRLDRVAGDGHFTDHSRGSFKPNFCSGWFAIVRLVNAGAVVVLDIVSRNLKIVDIAVQRFDPRLFVRVYPSYAAISKTFLFLKPVFIVTLSKKRADSLDLFFY
jgi:hypothetical protein